jgi:hypothetical protein
LGIATSATRGRKPIQIQSEALRGWEPSASFLAARGFALLPDEPVTDREQAGVQPGGCWREADLKRAIAVAEKAGLRAYRVEIAPDGTISIIVGGEDRDAAAGDD